MRLRLVAFALVGLAGPVSAQVRPNAGLIIERSSRLTPGIYDLQAPDGLDTAVIVVRGDNIVLDLSGVELRGLPVEADPDSAAGVAILVDGGENVTIRGGTLRGYRIAILARGTRNLRLIDNDVSYNWKPRLYSLVEHESLADWLSFHQNEKDEWLRFGAGIYLAGVRGGEITGNTARQGMNALLMTRTDSLLVWNNDVSFNSGLGIGMYRSSHNRILHNRVEFNVRGYSEGFYRRGQDSAGILMYQQCTGNIVAFNAVTHGGDGLFVWAGQHTMDTGEGGVNDNVFYGNDFSWAPTNGMEATFSRNVFVRNRIVGSDYGLWGGYSHESLVADNTFERNRIGIAIEHGQDNRILNNTFTGDSTGIWLWANPIEPGDWGYPKHRDTRSRDYVIQGNMLRGVRTGLRIRQSSKVDARNNQVDADTVVVASDTSGFRVPGSDDRAQRVSYAAPWLAKITAMPNARPVLPSAYADWPRSTIIVDDWGPYDWRSPKLWPVDSSRTTPLRLRVLGPPGSGSWRLLNARGATLSRRTGAVGDTIIVTPASGRIEDWTITLEYRGEATRSPRGTVRPAGTPYVFSYSRFDPRLTWDVRVYSWADSTHPLETLLPFRALVRGERGAPVLTRNEQRLDYMWFRPTIRGWPQTNAALSATTEMDLPEGEYLIRAISDDGIRVWVDDRLVIDDWSVHESRVREAVLPAGKHRVQVQYFQGDGWAELRVEILKR